MSAAERFLDTNVLLYLLSGDDVKAARAESELWAGGVVSVQVLNEFASVAFRKLKMSITEIREVLTAVRAGCKIVPISEESHDLGLQVAERYGLSIYDAIIVASALLARCGAPSSRKICRMGKFRRADWKFGILSADLGLSAERAPGGSGATRSLSGQKASLAAGASYGPPLAHNHINMLGRYAFTLPEPVARGELRPLRSPAALSDDDA